MSGGGGGGGEEYDTTPLGSTRPGGGCGVVSCTMSAPDAASAGGDAQAAVFGKNFQRIKDLTCGLAALRASTVASMIVGLCFSPGISLYCGGECGCQRKFRTQRVKPVQTSPLLPQLPHKKDFVSIGATVWFTSHVTPASDTYASGPVQPHSAHVAC